VKKQSRESIGWSFVDLVEKTLCQVSQRSDVTTARNAAIEDVLTPALRHGPEPFAKRPIMSVTNQVPDGPIESLAL